MATPFEALQKGMYDKLTSLTYKVYDHRPENKAFPYIVIGEDSLASSHTKTKEHYTVISTVHVFSNKTGGIELKRIMDAIVNNVKRGMAITGWAITHNEVLLFDYFEDSLPDVLHGVIQLELQIIKV